MLSPGNVEAIDPLVYGLQTMDVRRREFFRYDDDEVNVTVQVEITYRERALEIGAHEVGAQDRLHALYEIP